MATAFEINRQATVMGRIPPVTRRDLETIAGMAGIPARDIGKATITDLQSIFKVALRDGDSAMRVARKIAMRLDDTLLGMPDPEGAPYGEPSPRPTAPAQVDMAAIRAMIKTEVREGALDPLQAALDATQADTNERLSELSADMEENTVERLKPIIETWAKQYAAEALKSMTPTRLEITRDSGDTAQPIGIVHRDTAKIINALSAGVNVYLHGPAGSGKTTVARKVAEAFMLQFYFAAKVESEYQLMGFKDAKGETVRTQFREAYELGGVFLFDEMDASSPSAVVALNAALANGICPFPDAIVSRHKDFICLGAGNTKLTGANRQYAGRSQLDAASIDRFAFIEFGYDDELERALATNQKWCAYVQSVRAAIAERGLNHLVTPRATYDGCKLLAKGLDWDTVATMCVYKGLDADTVKQVEAAINPTRMRA